ncbi:hypothetical protein, partial [Serratia marcescens]|uniref:hypothetical protein n=1 Tax=Serratia marcescens TaxID=615 RepID=UPI00195380B8
FSQSSIALAMGSVRLDEVTCPPIKDFLEDIAKFLNMDCARPTHGARECKFIVMHAICNELE